MMSTLRRLRRAHAVEGGPELLPGELAVVGELAGAGEPFASVHRDAVAGLVGAEVREEEDREVGDLVSRAFFSASAPAMSRENAPSVGIGPGAIALTRIPACPHSTASERVMASTPALAQAEGRANAVPVQAYVVTIDTMAPGAWRASRCRPTASVQLTVP
jgi:hypothetical protein